MTELRTTSADDSPSYFQSSGYDLHASLSSHASGAKVPSLSPESAEALQRMVTILAGMSPDARARILQSLDPAMRDALTKILDAVT